jgi:hypothetical protein
VSWALTRVAAYGLAWIAGELASDAPDLARVAAVVVAAEKLWSHGEHVARFAGYVSIALAVVVVFRPEIAPGLDPDNVMMGM